jgi:hypothetical protein
MKAFELLEKYGWCQYAWARNAEGLSAPIESDMACSFCTRGALERVGAGRPALEKLARHLSLYSTLQITAWNDHPERTKEEVIALLKELDI